MVVVADFPTTFTGSVTSEHEVNPAKIKKAIVPCAILSTLWIFLAFAQGANSAGAFFLAEGKLRSPRDDETKK